MTNKKMLVKIFIYLTFILFSLGQLGRISFFNQQVNGYLYEFGILLLLMAFVTKYKLKPIIEEMVRFKIIFIFFLALLFSFSISISDYKVSENAISFLYFLRFAFYFIFFLYLFFYLKKDKEAKTIVRNGLMFFIALTVITSLIQYFLYPNLRNLQYLGWDPHQFRLFGLFFDTSVSGAAYGLIFLFILLQGKRFVKSESLRAIMLGVFFVFIVLTFSRSLYLVFFGTITLLSVAYKRYRQLFIFIGIFLFLLVLTPKPGGEGINLARIFTVSSRLNDYKIGSQIWQKYPLFGIGYNRIRYAKLKLNAQEEERLLSNHAGSSFHSSFLIILVTGGIFGLLGLLGVLYKFAIFGQTSMYLTLFVSLLSLTDNIFLHPFILFLFIVFASLVE